MIDNALTVLTKNINNHLKDLFKSSDNKDKIELTPVVDLKGEVAITSDSLGLTLINIEEERTLKSQMAPQ